MATPAEITAFTLAYANQNPQFESPGDDAEKPVTPSLNSFGPGAFNQFADSLTSFMSGKGVQFLFVPDEMRGATTWRRVSSFIALNQQ